MLVKKKKEKKKRKKESFEDSICTFWNDFQANHLKSIKWRLELWQFSGVILAATCIIPMWLWRSLINLSEPLPRWSVWLSRVPGLKLPFMDSVLYRSRSFSGISQTFTFSISPFCRVSPPAEGGVRHRALESSPYSFPDTVAERTKPLWATCQTPSHFLTKARKKNGSQPN